MSRPPLLYLILDPGSPGSLRFWRSPFARYLHIWQTPHLSTSCQRGLKNFPAGKFFAPAGFAQVVLQCHPENFPTGKFLKWPVKPTQEGHS